MKATVLVLSDPGCGHCVDYYSNSHARLKNLIANDSAWLKLEEVKIVGTPGGGYQYKTVSGADVHPDLYNSKRWGNHVPSFIIVTTASWLNHKRELEGYILGYDYVSGALVPNEEYSRNAVKIYEWIKRCLALPLFNRAAASGPSPTASASSPTAAYASVRFNGIYSSRQ